MVFAHNKLSIYLTTRSSRPTQLIWVPLKPLPCASTRYVLYLEWMIAVPWYLYLFHDTFHTWDPHTPGNVLKTLMSSRTDRDTYIDHGFSTLVEPPMYRQPHIDGLPEYLDSTRLFRWVPPSQKVDYNDAFPFIFCKGALYTLHLIAFV